jgi:hypothetical protein
LLLNKGGSGSISNTHTAKSPFRYRRFKNLMQQRSITQQEKDLIQHLVKCIPDNTKDYQIPPMVTQLDDGGMGSLQLNNDTYGRDLIQVQYKDTDGQLVLITLVEGKSGVLQELDVWKVDFTLLKKFPTIDRIETVT